MADSTATFIPDTTPGSFFLDNSEPYFKVFGKIVITAGNYKAIANGGMPLSFSGFDVIKSLSPPKVVYINEQTPGGNSGYLFSYVPAAAATLANGSLQIQQNGAGSAPNLELSNGGATPASVVAAVLVVEAVFPKFQ